MKIYKRLMAYAQPYGRFLTPFIVFTLISVVFNVFQFALIIPLLKFLFNPISTADAARYAVSPAFSLTPTYLHDLFYHLIYQLKATNPVYVLYFIAGMIVVAVVMTNLFRFLAQRTLLSARTLLVKRLREALFEKINNLHLGYFTKEQKGDLLSRLNGDVYAIESVASSSVEVVFKEPFMLIAYFVALFAISYKLTLFTLLIIPISAIGISAVTKKLKKEAKDVQTSMGRMLTLMDETLMGMRILRAFNATPFVLNRFAVENDFYRKVSLDNFKRRELAPAFSEASGVFVVACILVFGGTLVLSSQSELQASSFIAFIAIFSQVIRPAKAIVVAITNIQQGQAAGERVVELLDKPIEIQDKPDARPMPPFQHEIVFDNVSFQYGEKPVLKNISFKIGKGKKIALVGPSGVGKSTIADLIPRFYETNQGRVTIDGVDVQDFKMESLRAQMSFVTQEIILFNDTIFNNIALGKPDAKLEDVIEAAKVANAHQFIVDTEDGYNTIIGDRGIRLSGGQRQRLSIARAVFKKPSILILDEATSALDLESEKSVQDALDNLMEGRTTLVIAHRLSTIREADEILIMEKGEIIERGNHYELINQENSIYRRLNTMHEVLQ
ncbi:ATP-binding cassette, subfamily B, MsbA [Spirosoma oryzae]|uniref:ATP-binding cassette, subfamily B, MsbA n=1 Tax=Spirosoma oryzae TaxID=1469603 RepID=A0A2T0S6S0_9BACT|nr:ABC transporter ATP-binding protein [Spirosoma oryzae]PRY29114.1 ATP-binding cassette, subfamily B, MsbA [Spirosoma oryzae]